VRWEMTQKEKKMQENSELGEETRRECDEAGRV
jgi:hypothetical protein